MEKISLKERFSYGLGDLACNLMFQLITAYLMFFYTDVAGIGLGAISLIMLVARVVDAVTDPMMGVIIDKTHTRWGKARPYVLWMAVPSESSAHPCSWYRISAEPESLSMP